MADYTGPLPVPTPESRPFWEALKRNELRLQSCRACGHCYFYPRSNCPRCLSGDVEWRHMSGRGTLHTFTIVHRGLKGFPLQPTYVLAVVELAEGPRMMTNLVGCPHDPAKIRIGAAVEIVYTDVTAERTLPHFRLVGAE